MPSFDDPEFGDSADVTALASTNNPADLANLIANLGSQLVWRMGRDDLSDQVIVRVGYASATPEFGHLSRLRSVTDAELEEALEQDELVIEWVG